MELHEQLGPSRTTMSAIAERAGVGRPTVYAHFPDEAALFLACSAHWREAHPLPDPARWLAIADDSDRIRAALRDVYAYHHGAAAMTTKIVRDLALVASIAAVAAPLFEEWMNLVATLADSLGGVPAARRAELRAAVSHALSVETWRSLVEVEGLRDDRAVELMVAMIESTRDDRHTSVAGVRASQ